jgi:hypothetical protein
MSAGRAPPTVLPAHSRPRGTHTAVRQLTQQQQHIDTDILRWLVSILFFEHCRYNDKALGFSIRR